MRFGSLFAGIGGLDLGFERAGMECAWQVEWDDYCTKVLEKHWPNVRRYGDVKGCGVQNLEWVDLICGGFPCQPVSTAGKRKGAKDERWLWPEFHRIVRELRPRWVVVENVPGLYSIEDGRLMGGILRDLAESGYDAEWDCIPAAAVGAPHLRYRVFIVADAKGIKPWKQDTQQGWKGIGPGGREGGGLERCGGAEDVAHAEGERCREAGRHSDQSPERVASSGQDMADTKGRWGGKIRNEGQTQGTQHGNELFGNSSGLCGGANWWTIEPDVGRVAHGVSARVDRLRCLGNAVVPQVAEWIGRRILQEDGGDEQDQDRIR